MQRNFDGQYSTFGETSVAAAVPQPDDLSAFAALRATDGALPITIREQHNFTTRCRLVRWRVAGHRSVAKQDALTSAEVK